MTRRLLFLALVLAVTQQTVFAQTDGSTLYVSMSQGSSLVLFEIDTGKRAITRSFFEPGLGGESYATPDGRYLVGRRFTPQPPWLIGWDRRTRTPPANVWRIAAPSWPHVLGHPSRLEVYEIDETLHAIAVTPSGVRRLNVPPPCVPSAIRAISANGRRLAIGCAVSPTVGIVVYDLEQERVVREFPQSSSFPLALSHDGTALFMFIGQTTLRKFAVDSGEVLAERELPHAGWVYVDPYSTRVFVAGDQRLTMPEDGTVVLDPDTLSPLVTAAPELGAIWVFDPDRPLAYTLKSTFVGSGYRTRLVVVDTTTLAAIQTADLPPFLATAGALVPRPSAPTGLTAVVSGNLVQLSWVPGWRGVPTHYVVEAGSAPERSDLVVLDVGLNTTVVVSPVPSGRYFVRVRAANVDGLGMPSGTLTVTVR